MPLIRTDQPSRRVLRFRLGRVLGLERKSLLVTIPHSGLDLGKGGFEGLDRTPGEDLIQGCEALSVELDPGAFGLVTEEFGEGFGELDVAV
jgi:hypothetical protein